MMRSGLHSAYTEAEGRGRQFLWAGVPPKTDLTIFAERSWHAPYAALGLRMTGAGGAAIRPGFKGYRSVPFDCSIMGVHLVGDAAGSIVFDIYRSTVAAGPPGQSGTLTPLSASRPTLDGVQMKLDLALQGWNTALHNGELLGFDVLSVSGLNSVTLTLLVAPNDRL